MFWHEAGQGDAILLLHGTWQDSSQWHPLLQILARDYHCIAPDLLGFGESSAASAPYSIELEAENMAALLSRLRIGPVYLVGHSVGAWVALAMAQRYPDRVRGVLVIEPEGFRPPSLKGRWWADRWLVAPWSPLSWVWPPLSPLLQRVGSKGWLGAWHRRRQRLRHAPAACQLLFRRRQSEISAELVSAPAIPQTMPLGIIESTQADATTQALTQACLQALPQASHYGVPYADNALSLKPEAIADAVIELTHTFSARHVFPVEPVAT